MAKPRGFNKADFANAPIKRSSMAPPRIISAPANFVKSNTYDAAVSGNAAVGFVAAAGGVTFFTSMKQSGGFPSNGVKVITATVILMIGASLCANTQLEKPVKWLAILMLISVLIRNVPGFSKPTKKKGK